MRLVSATTGTDSMSLIKQLGLIIESCGRRRRGLGPGSSPASQGVERVAPRTTPASSATAAPDAS